MQVKDYLLIRRAMDEQKITPPDAEEPAAKRCEFCGEVREAIAIIDPWNPKKARRWVGWTPCTCPEALAILSEEMSRRDREVWKISDAENKQVLTRKLVEAGVGKKWIDLALHSSNLPNGQAVGYVNGLLEGNTNNAIVIGDGRVAAAAYIAKRLIEKGRNLMWITDGQLASTNFEGNAYRKMLDEAIKAEYLVIQDLGTSVMTQYTIGGLYFMLQMRDSDAKPAIVTVAGKYSAGRLHKQNAEAIAARIYGAMETSAQRGNDEAAKGILKFVMAPGYEPVYTEGTTGREQND